MSASSGIGVSPELTKAFAEAVDSKGTRFLKVKIQNESLVPDEIVPTESDELVQDLPKLQGILQDDVPAYVLARTDNSWLFISYVPDNAKVRDKMLYASTRGALTKALGDQRFKDSIFATSKSDLTPEAYEAHQRHLAAPKPLTARERELEDIRAAERETSSAYEGSGVRQSIVGSRVGMKWTDEVGEALKELPTNGGRAVVISIDPTNEVYVLKNTKDVTLEEFPGVLPTSEPAYGFYSWVQGDAAPHITSLVHDVKTDLGVVVAKRLEASDPSELDLEWLKNELTPAAGTGTQTPVDDSKKPFAKPRGPARRK
ncbi:Twinfilin-1 [Ceratobasidium sp. 395]|nr:Twinfilin-1 [Ceratobasidium sp. 395]